MAVKSRRGTNSPDPDEIISSTPVVTTSAIVSSYLPDMVNRRTLYNPKYDKLLAIHLGEGKSFDSFDIAGGVSTMTLTNWCKKHPTFAAAREVGEKAKLRFLEDEGIKMVKGGNVTAWKFMMGLQGLSEKVEISHSIQVEGEKPSSERQVRLLKIKALHARAMKEESTIDAEIVEEEDFLFHD